MFYAPSAVLTHDHPYTVESFLRRQSNAGRMAYVFITRHSEVAERIGVEGLLDALHLPESFANPDLYVAVIEGIKAAAQLAEADFSPGSQNWHGVALDAVFDLAYHQGFTSAAIAADPSLNHPAALRHALDTFRQNVSGALVQELFGDMPFAEPNQS